MLRGKGTADGFGGDLGGPADLASAVFEDARTTFLADQTATGGEVNPRVRTTSTDFESLSSDEII